MNRYVIGVLGVGVLGVAAWVGRPLYAPLIKEAPAQIQMSPESIQLTKKRDELLARIRQLRTGGTLAGRLVELQGRKDQLVRHYPEGHPDIELLDKQIATTKVALEKLPRLEFEYSTLTEKLEALNGKPTATKSKAFAWTLPKLPGTLSIPRLSFVAEADLINKGEVEQVNRDIEFMRSLDVVRTGLTLQEIPGSPTQIQLNAEDRTGSRAAAKLTAALDVVQIAFQEAMKNELHKKIHYFEEQKQPLDLRFARLTLERKSLLTRTASSGKDMALLAKIENLKARRRLLIESYPTHSDIARLADEIKSLLAQSSSRPARVAERASVYDRQLNETKVWIDYLGRRIVTLQAEEKTLSSPWELMRPIQTPRWPVRVIGWPVLIAGLLALISLGYVIRSRRKMSAPNDDVADPLLEVLSQSQPEEKKTVPVALEVVSPELPSDPLTPKAASFYERWMEVARVLYTPSPTPPEGVLESVGPLLQETCEFLPEGHDVLARYLARSVEPGNLPAHVARTVLMALTGAEEAGVTSDHRLAMALAALFHDLAVVPRPAAQQDDVGSEVGRLSASLLRRIPGLEPGLLAMVEDILIGMDEFKLATWQNVSADNVLEPLSKVLREIDRFEKVMQKQKARMQRQLKAASAS